MNEQEKDLAFLADVSEAFRKAYEDKEWLLEQGEKYLEAAEELSNKRFESWKGTWTKFVR